MYVLFIKEFFNLFICFIMFLMFNKNLLLNMLEICTKDDNLY